jgi:hypothetical protein
MTQYENHHLGVYFYLNTSTSPAPFRLGVSTLGGSDVLGSGGTGRSWQNLQTYVTEITYDNTLTLQGINAEYTGLQIDLVLSADTDIFEGTGFSVGTWVKVTLENYVPAHSTYPMWYVKVRSFTKQLDAEGMFTWQIHAEDVLQDVMGTPVADFSSDDYTLFGDGYSILYTVDYQFGRNPLNVPDFETTHVFLIPEVDRIGVDYGRYDTITVVDGSVADIVQPIIQGSAGWVYSTGQSPVLYVIAHNDLISGDYRTPVLEFSNDETDSHIAVASLDIGQDSTTIVNDLLLTLTLDPATTLAYTDQDLVDIYGRNRQDLDFLLLDEAELVKYKDMVAAASKPQIIKAITCDAIHHKNRHLSDVWKLYPSTLVTVNVSTPDITVNKNYFVTGVKHTITPEGWNTTVELWSNN